MRFVLFRILFLLAAILAGGLGHVLAQGGPPMITDDPGTPGNGQWEINLAWTDARTPGTSVYGLPLLDANYGVGERVELTYEAPWAIVQDAQGARSGPGNSLVGAKWRFCDEGEHGWQASVYPQFTFLDPGSHSALRGLADPGTSLLLPFEVARDFGPIAVNFDFGHIFSSESGGSGWAGGVLLGHNVTKEWELDAEFHATTSQNLRRSEQILNLGTRVGLTDHLILLLALGRDLGNQLGPRASLLSYAGVQILF
jgi:hypothetical protein